MDVKNERQEEIPEKRARREDVEFTPTVEMMVHEYDDERTLEEEEALGPLEDPSAELSSLEKEGNMPIEDLMAMYGYNDTDTRTTQSSEEMNGEKPNESETVDKKSPSRLEQIYNDMEPDGELEPNTRATRYGSRAQSEEEEDYEYGPDEEEERKKTIMVGSDYQAYIPDIMCKYDDALPYENQDKLMWDPVI
uniref:ELM2 domain-containing protein n=1 Tax=Lygus hesperus TaxID=30085 RepID=A0A0K8T2T3_LYGHE